MHYVICYDIESDRKRDRVARVLEKNGCRRVQKSVFVGPRMRKRELLALQRDLIQTWTEGEVFPSDSVLIIPLGDDRAGHPWALGYDGLSDVLKPPPRKVQV